MAVDRGLRLHHRTHRSPIGMEGDSPTAARAVGALLTWVVLAGLAIAALYAAYSANRAVPAPPALAAQV